MNLETVLPQLTQLYESEEFPKLEADYSKYHREMTNKGQISGAHFTQKGSDIFKSYIKNYITFLLDDIKCKKLDSVVTQDASELSHVLGDMRKKSEGFIRKNIRMMGGTDEQKVLLVNRALGEIDQCIVNQIERWNLEALAIEEQNKKPFGEFIQDLSPSLRKCFLEVLEIYKDTILTATKPIGIFKINGDKSFSLDNFKKIVPILSKYRAFDYHGYPIGYGEVQISLKPENQPGILHPNFRKIYDVLKGSLNIQPENQNNPSQTSSIEKTSFSSDFRSIILYGIFTPNQARAIQYMDSEHKKGHAKILAKDILAYVDSGASKMQALFQIKRDGKKNTSLI